MTIKKLKLLLNTFDENLPARVLPADWSKEVDALDISKIYQAQSVDEYENVIKPVIIVELDY